MASGRHGRHARLLCCRGAGAGIGDLRILGGAPVASLSRCSLKRRAMANTSDDGILLLFCPTEQRLFVRTDQRLRSAPKPLIPLMPATVHGVVFDIFVWTHDSARLNRT